MLSYRYDQLQFSSEIPNYINLGTPTASLPVSGTFINGAGTNFTATINLSATSTFLDVYVTNSNTGLRTLLQNDVSIDSVWQFVSSETVQNLITIANGVCTVQISMTNNTGSTITLIPQTFQIEAVEYQIPY